MSSTSTGVLRQVRHVFLGGSGTIGGQRGSLAALVHRAQEGVLSILRMPRDHPVAIDRVLRVDAGTKYRPLSSQSTETTRP